VIGEVELSPTTISRLASPPNGVRYVLLDPQRDSAFLSSSSIVNPDGTHDGGLGVVDNGIFVYTSAVNPATGNAREYPNKFFWIGSPKGTNDSNDAFSIYVADVNSSAFYPNAPASAWLLNPRLVLHISQAKQDVINWFDNNYPGGASGGKGSGISGSNNSYGTLARPNPNFTYAPGDISAMNSIDGQFWPVYDYVDNTVLLYFSIKTPNANTLSIYCYKLNDTEFSSPAGSSQFLGGVYGNFWSGGAISVTSSHRFSLVSPDPLVAGGRTLRQQSAVGFYAFGTFDGATPDHARFIQAFILTDIHGSPLDWSSPFQVSNTGGLDSFGIYNVDKLGSIQAVSSGNNHVQGSYACVYNATSDRDVRSTSNAVVISAMQIRVCYYQPASNAITHGAEPIVPQGEINEVGHCRPQFTFLPDGFPKILSAAWTPDQYLNIGYNYFPHDVLAPERQKQLGQSYDSFTNPVTIPTYGKRRVRIIINAGIPGIASPNPQNIQTVAQVMEAYSLSSTFQQSINEFNDLGTLLLNSQNSPYDYNGNQDWSKIFDAWLEDVDAPFLRIKALGNSSAGTYVYGIINLED
jgi:hypothetical protein